MRRHTNLISDSALIGETIEYLKIHGGRLSAIEIANDVLQIPIIDSTVAKFLVTDLVAADPRLFLNENGDVELTHFNFEARKLTDCDYVVFDTETTGAKPPYSRMTEIGAYKVRNGKIVGEFETLVNPNTPIPPFISALTGITDAMVGRAPQFSEIVVDLLDFIGDSILVAHNAAFDVRFLNAEIARVFREYQIANAHLCTVRLARKLLPNLRNHRLHTVAEHFSIPIFNRHRAGGDALATAKIFINLLEDLQRRGVADVGGACKFKI